MTAGARPKGAVRSRSLARSLCALAVALVALHYLFVALSRSAPIPEGIDFEGSWVPAIFALAFSTVGLLVAMRLPHNAIGWLFLAIGLTWAAGLAAAAYATYSLLAGHGPRAFGETMAWLQYWNYVPALCLAGTFLLLLFPNGRLLSTRWRPVAWGSAAGIAVLSVAVSLAPRDADPFDFENPFAVHGTAATVAAGFEVAAGSLVAVCIIASAASLVVRFRRAHGDERHQLKWFAYAAALTAIAFPVSGVLWGVSDEAAGIIQSAAIIALPVAAGIAILKHRLYEIDILVNRTLVYGGLTAGVVAVYGALVGAVGALSYEGGAFWFSILATGLAALLVLPLRARLQRLVNRFMYGVYADEGVAAGLGGRLQAAFAPEAAYLQRSRERLVTAREEERRRIRRDLHDGLGPALAGIALTARGARNLLARDPASSEELLAKIEDEARAATDEIRRLVYELRPPALDELGLVGALREQASRLGSENVVSAARSDSDGLQVAVEGPADLPALPAAVEAAAYRIAVEALTNVARHAAAHVCTIRVDVDGTLDVEIDDDGRGLPPDARFGVGFDSMRERAEELGGRFTVEPRVGGGTRVRASLPIAPA